MKIFVLLLLFVALLNGCAPKQISLFNGHNLDGWIIVANNGADSVPGLFFVEDGVIKTHGKPNGYLRTKEAYSNYRLHLEWRWADDPGNSGVLLHASGEEFWPDCVEAQLMNDHAGDVVLIGLGTSGLFSDSLFTNRSGRYTVLPKEGQSTEFSAGEWNRYDIRCADNQLSIEVNGILQNQVSELNRTRGFIALQSEGAPIEFRNLYIDPL
ncbi:MAG TPA: DUF1080 domain-containing protein [Prolixibacteraceae bacterium]|nr:DUF1080 domain-containing protein [Prolixibacteraceae bacterium]